MADKNIYCDNMHYLGSFDDLQSFGYLMVLDNKHQIVNISANFEELLGYNPKSVLGISAVKVLPGLNESIKKVLRMETPHQKYINLPILINDKLKFYAFRHRKIMQHHIIEIEPTEMTDEIKLSTVIPNLEKKFLETKNTNKLNQVFVRELRKYFKFDKVMVYRFHRDWSGTVVAESNKKGMAIYAGLRFPAQDVPEPVRENYKHINFRYIPDINYVGQTLLGKKSAAMDMILPICEINSVMSVHKKYLNNMSISCSMSLPIFVKDELWGLVACHHQSEFSLTPSNRFAMRLLVNYLAMHVALIEDYDFIEREEMLTDFNQLVEKEINETNNLNKALLSADLNLLKYIDAKGYVSYVNEKISKRGKTPTNSKILEIIDWLKQHDIKRIYSTHKLLDEFPGELSKDFCGLLAMSISKQNNDFLLFFRPEIVGEVIWAGDPNYRPKELKNKKDYNPRNSFAKWQQQVKGQSKIFNGYDLGCAEIIRNILNNKLFQELLATKAYIDPLTNLYNARFMKEKLVDKDVQLDKRANSNIVCMLDIDKFKNINDTYGHPFGDRTLAYVASIIQNNVRDIDIACRYGGEEFLVILKACKAAEGRRILENIRQKIEKSHLLYGNKKVKFTISIGYHVASNKEHDMKKMIEQADNALYLAKSGGRNRVICSDN